MPQYTAAFDLSSLDGTNGFRILGEARFNRTGTSVAPAGDVNGDGISDIVIGTGIARIPDGYDGPIQPEAITAAYVIFGATGSFGDGTGTLNLSTVDGTNGFKILTEPSLDYGYHSVSGAGDFNGDGIGDLILGMPLADAAATPHSSAAYNAGGAYIIFGTSSPVGASFQLSALNDQNGVRVTGSLPNGTVGTTVASAGDFNNDGYADATVVPTVPLGNEPVTRTPFWSFSAESWKLAPTGEDVPKMMYAPPALYAADE